MPSSTEALISHTDEGSDMDAIEQPIDRGQRLNSGDRANVAHSLCRARRRARAISGVGVLVVAGLLLAACGGSKSTSAAGPSAVPSGNGRPAGSGAGVRGPAAYGLAAAINGHTIEVQDPATGQVSVVYTSKTTFSQARTTSAASIVAGECVTASAPTTATGAASGSSASAAPTPGGQPTAFTATSVVVTPAVNGACGGGFSGGFGGNRPSGAARPSGAPSGNRTGASRFGDLASGKVLSVAGGTVTVQATNRGTGTNTTDTITTTTATKVTVTVAATAAALKVGECVTATGSANSIGVVTATRIALSTPGATGCTVGFGRGFGGGSTGAGAGGAAAGGSGSGGSGSGGPNA